MDIIGVIANCRKKRAPAVLKKLSAEANKHGLEIVAAEETADLLPECRCLDERDMFDLAEAVLVLGGDGSMLRAARDMEGIERPLMGVNIGSLGFMTSVAEEDLGEALKCLKNDDLIVSERAMAACAVIREGDSISRYRALNDVVITSGGSPRIVTLGVTIDGDSVTSYHCDGLVVSTPTGSTGHSLSAGGPILTPHTHAFVMSLICPHTLSSRPLVVQDQSEICVRVDDKDSETLLSVDGQVGQPLAYKDHVVVRRSESNVTFLHLPGYDYFAVLRQKLHWGGLTV